MASGSSLSDRIAAGDPASNPQYASSMAVSPLNGFSQTGGPGNDTIDGGVDDDTLSGAGGNDSIDGGDGDDILDGGVGDDDDTYYVGQTDTVIETGAGTGDMMIATEAGTYGPVAGIEILVADAGLDGIHLIGNGGANTLIGNERANTLEGGTGNDTILAGAGDDAIDGGVGNDLIKGGAGRDTLLGGAGNDTLVSGSDGSSQFDGGVGDDVYILNGKGDDILSDAGGAHDIAYIYSANFDTVAARDAYAAQLHNRGIEDVIFDFPDPVFGANTAPIGLKLTGNWAYEGSSNGTTIGSLSAIDPDQGDTFTYTLVGDAGGRFKIVGNRLQVADGTLLDYEQAGSHAIIVQVTDAANNTYQKTLEITVRDWWNEAITGTSRDDVIRGGGGNDTLRGGDGDDTLGGGLGADVLTGGAGHDVFVFDTDALAHQADKIKDFTRGEDMIRLKGAVFGLQDLVGGPLDSRVFGTGSHATTAEQRILYDAATGTLYYDKDGSGSAAAKQIAVLTTRPALDLSDFLVI